MVVPSLHVLQRFACRCHQVQMLEQKLSEVEVAGRHWRTSKILDKHHEVSTLKADAPDCPVHFSFLNISARMSQSAWFILSLSISSKFVDVLM